MLLLLDPNDAPRNPLDWTQITREEAQRALSLGGPVVAAPPGYGTATWFNESCPYLHAQGPYDYSSLKYFLFKGRRTVRPNRPRGQSSRTPSAAPSTPFDTELETYPLAEAESPRLSGSDHRTRKTESEGFRFDLALNPASEKVQGDIFVLTGLDSDFSQVRTVRDDKVPGDNKLTLIFTDVEEGKWYSLSQMHGDQELVLVPEAIYRAAPANGPKPGQVVGCKAVFRECGILGESTDLWKQQEAEYHFELGFIKEKWVYVFGGPKGGPQWLIAEGLGTSDGRFRPVDLKRSRGQDQREAIADSVEWITLPLRVDGREWDLFACLSPIQLGWKRIGELEKAPAARCYHLGESTGGIAWVPGHIGREVPKLSGSRDPRLGDPGADIVLFGLYDHMAEAKRRAGEYRKRVEAYLEVRFDHPGMGDTQGKVDGKRRKKYVAGILKVLMEKHPLKHRIRAGLEQRGLALDEYLRTEDDAEQNLKSKAEAAGAALVKWLDSSLHGFEEVKRDYTADPSQPGYWELIEAEFASLIQYFDVTSLTRLYSRKILERKDSWLNRFFLNPDAFAGTRKSTQATAEILTWLGKVMVWTDKLSVESLERIHGIWFPGIRLEWAAYSSQDLESRLLDAFPDERKAPTRTARKVHFQSLETPGMKKQLRIVRLSKSCAPLDKLGKVADAKVVKAVMMGIEGMNLALAFRQFDEKPVGEATTNLFGTVFDSASMLGESVKFGKKQLGRGFLSTLGLVSAGIDSFIAVRESWDEAQEADYDAMAAKATIAAGSASIAVGSAMVAGTIFSSVAGGFFTAGAGISMTGAGTPLGATLCLGGMVIVAAGSLAYALLNDTDLEKWVKNCPLGTQPEWSFDLDGEAKRRIRHLHETLFPYDTEVRHQFLTGRSDYELSIKGNFNPYTKVKIRQFSLIDKNGGRLDLLDNDLLSESSFRPYRLKLHPGEPSLLSLRFPDSWCWDQHRKNHPDAPNGFKSYLLDLEIDVEGNGEIVWPATRKAPHVREIGA